MIELMLLLVVFVPASVASGANRVKQSAIFCRCVNYRCSECVKGRTAGETANCTHSQVSVTSRGLELRGMDEVMGQTTRRRA